MGKRWKETCNAIRLTIIETGTVDDGAIEGSEYSARSANAARDTGLCGTAQKTGRHFSNFNAGGTIRGMRVSTTAIAGPKRGPRLKRSRYAAARARRRRIVRDIAAAARANDIFDLPMSILRVSREFQR